MTGSAPGSVEPVSPVPPRSIRRPVAEMLWQDPVLLHWPCDPDLLAHRLPPDTRPDVRGGRAWIGLVCLQIRCARVLGLPALPEPGLAEVNLRT